MRLLLRGLTLIAFTVLLNGCAGMQSRAVSSSYAFLYPNVQNKIEEPGLAVLKLPIRVGLAFVPETQSSRGFSFWHGGHVTSHIPEARKHKLLTRVADEFRSKEFIDTIEVIPSAYLRPGGSFENLQQIGTMYNLDVIALVSYDQMQTTDEDIASLTYWTLVGAYLVQGEKNTTTTLIDTVVYDIDSRRMLFRAPGISEIKDSATLVNQTEALREDSQRGMSLAADEMIKNLDVELGRFREKVKERPNDYKVVPSPGYSGGGAISMAFLPLLFMRKRSRINCTERTCVNKSTLRCLFLVAMLVLTPQVVMATTWATKTVVDPISGSECEVQTPASSGSYIYDWPSKYDGVFWPYTEFSWLWYCPTSGYVSFGDDFDDLTSTEKTRISGFLKTIAPALPQEMNLETRLWLADMIYQMRDKDSKWRGWYQRVRAQLLESLAHEARREAIPMLESSLAGGESDIDAVISRMVLARYKSCFMYGTDGASDMALAEKQIVENAATFGENAVTYLRGLAEDMKKKMAECNT